MNNNGPFDEIAIGNALVNANVQTAMRKALSSKGEQLVPALLRSITTDIAVIKGDLTGHPFRGNQWTTGEAQAAAEKAADEAYRAAGGELGAGGRIALSRDGGHAVSIAGRTTDAAMRAGSAARAALRVQGFKQTAEKAGSKSGYRTEHLHTSGMTATVHSPTKESGKVLVNIRVGKVDVADLHKIHNHTTGEWRVEDADGHTISKFATEAEADALMRKGDLPGHPFRGNQYVGGGAPEVGHEVSVRTGIGATNEGAKGKVVEVKHHAPTGRTIVTLKYHEVNLRHPQGSYYANELEHK